MGAGADEGIDQIARSFDQIHAMIPSHKVVTLLETSAGQGSCVGCSFEELGKIRERIDDPARVGVCVDTCHIFASGYDIRTRHGYEQTIEQLEQHIGSRMSAPFTSTTPRSTSAAVSIGTSTSAKGSSGSTHSASRSTMPDSRASPNSSRRRRASRRNRIEPISPHSGR
jgi:hypothetical protein